MTVKQMLRFLEGFDSEKEITFRAVHGDKVLEAWEWWQGNEGPQISLRPEGEGRVIPKEEK